MTSKELHNQKILPLRKELQRLEKEYEYLYHKECGERIGATASCDNCAYSCVLRITDHNECMNGNCTCCRGWCYSWIPENEVSKFLRKNYQYDDELFYRLESLFGKRFLTRCDSPEKTKVVMEALSFVERLENADKALNF